MGCNPVSVITRFAPSPTGYLHIGGARTALFSWLHARKNQGKFLLRIEDTDLARSNQASVQAILDGMQWLGLQWDEEPYFQTQRLAHYRRALEQLLDQGCAYRCYCTQERLNELRVTQQATGAKPRYDGHCRDTAPTATSDTPYVVRFKTPRTGHVTISDRVYGQIQVDNSELDDLIIARSDGMPTYNLCVVVDDLQMQISDVIRGEDHINNTARQIHIVQALGGALPRYAHLPMILGVDGQRLSKRHAATNVMEYRTQGYLPEALLNYLARLGWSCGDLELFSLQKLIELFSLDAVNKSGAMFDADKLNWINRQHIMNITPKNVLYEGFVEQLQAHNIAPLAGADKISGILQVMSGRVDTLAQMAQQSRYFFSDTVPLYNNDDAKKHLTTDAIAPLAHLRGHLLQIDCWDSETINAAVAQTLSELDIKLGKLAPALRVAVTGAVASPPIYVTLALIGKATVIERIDCALAHINAAG